MISLFGNFDSASPDSSLEGVVVTLALIGIGDGKVCDRLIKCVVDCKAGQNCDEAQTVASVAQSV